ncbi:MAG: xanthine dehydrogenase molybdopterin binding subunit [Ahrensia sp.]|nr:xanthine dehydrogenase molybdopterin binding subunit [Ahrensia sp.]
MNIQSKPPVAAQKLDAETRIVGHDHVHDSASRHVRGQAVYIDDMPDLPGTLHCAPVLSNVAHGKILNIDFDKARASEGVVDVLLASDIPGKNEVAPIFADEPFLAEGKVEHVGQIVGLVVADTLAHALQAARKVVVDIEELTPCFDEAEAFEAQSRTLPDQHLKRGDAQQAIEAAARRLTGRVKMGGQDHFYLEAHTAHAFPGEAGDMTVWSSTQHPTEVQVHVAMLLGVKSHKVDVKCRRMGGAFGGKESQATIIAGLAALAAHATGQPCRFRMRRDDDMAATGKRHGYTINYDVGFDETGRIHGLKVEALAHSGHVADLTGPVIARTLTHLDNCYHIEHADFLGFAAKTNTVSNTAFRGFGGPQGMVAIEAIIDDIARSLGRDAQDIRAANYYGAETGSETPYGQSVFVGDELAHDNPLRNVIERVTSNARWDEKRTQIEAFNAKRGVLRKGLAMMPVKFGISFNLTTLNQGGALVHVYMDGSVHLNHGGTEMGQGLNTKVAQVVAEVFGIPLGDVQITPSDTGKVPNTSATAASSGSDLNGMAAFNAASEIKARMLDVACEHFDAMPSDIDFRDGQVVCGDRSISFGTLAKYCWMKRISLSAEGFYATPKIHWDGKTMKGRPFFYFTYGAAVAEVVIDTLTGENRCLSVDIVQDCGKSLNPVIDLGQIEGAFVQGMGWLTCEELWWDEKGRLRTVGPSTYKIPGSRDVPPVFNVELLENRPNPEETVYRSKAVGEPPLMLSIAVWLALRDAVSSLSGHRLAAALDAPATPERVLFAVEDMKERAGELI